jgi:NAD(P)-dependent dehydrogenase (short-subunit alcohol dehydrogenase family)
MLSASTEESPMSTGNQHTVVITGGTGGIGYQSAVGIAETGARLLITGRNRERGDTARQRLIEETGNDRVQLVVGDVSSIAGVKALARDLLEETERIDVLVNNAGYLGNERRESDDGLEMHFAVNVLAPWQLTLALLPALKAADEARVVNVTGGDKPAPVDGDNLQAERGFKGLLTYQHSKAVTEAMTLALAERLGPEGVNVNVVFPGRASTAMTTSLSRQGLPGPMKLMMPFFRWFFREDGGKSAAKAARSTIWAATSPDLDGVSGRYFDTNTNEQRLHPTAYQADVQARILSVIDKALAAAC